MTGNSASVQIDGRKHIHICNEGAGGTNNCMDCSNKVLLKSEHFFDLGRLRCHSFATRPPRMIKDVSLARGMISCAGTRCGRRVPRSNQFPKISSEMNSKGL